MNSIGNIGLWITGPSLRVVSSCPRFRWNTRLGASQKQRSNPRCVSSGAQERARAVFISCAATADSTRFASRVYSSRITRKGCFGSPAVRINGPTAYIILYAAMYGAFGVASPFWPKFFETKALGSEQIGFILGAAMLVRLAAGPVVGRLADLWGALRLVLAACCALAAAT